MLQLILMLRVKFLIAPQNIPVKMRSPSSQRSRLNLPVIWIFVTVVAKCDYADSTPLKQCEFAHCASSNIGLKHT